FLYQSTIRQAAAAFVASWVVSKYQCSGSTPAGGSSSTTSSNVNLTVFGKARDVACGLFNVTRPARSANLALRTGRSARATTSMVVRSRIGQLAAEANILSSFANTRSCMHRDSRWKFAAATLAHLA